MAQKKVKVGSLIKNETETEVNGQKVKRTFLSIGLGNKSDKKPEFNQTVEIIVRDKAGKIIAQQTDGFLDVVDPRKEPEELLSANKISEEQFLKMKENVGKLSPKVKYVLRMRSA